MGRISYHTVGKSINILPVLTGEIFLEKAMDRDAKKGLPRLQVSPLMQPA
jgi:hypothetical protein